MQEPQQTPLFCETISEALKEAVKALGGPKKVGEKLRPEMAADAAGRWLSDCLNPECRAKLDLDQALWVLREARKVNYHGAMNFICSDTGYANPQPIEPEDEKAKLMREFIEATKQQTRNVERLERLSQTGLKAVA
jgi:hypothetical protein